MNVTATFVGGLLALAQMGNLSAYGAERMVTRTNWNERFITNVIEVNMPQNRFVNQYQTNWVTVWRTNLVELWCTNTSTVYATNLWTRHVTNQVAIDLCKTNFTVAYRTNLKVLNLTNWANVLVIKTNWVTQTITNVMEVEAQSTGAKTVAAASPAEPAPANLAAAPAGKATPLAEALALDAKRLLRATTNNQVAVQLSVRSTQDPAAPLKIQQWKIEREDGAILCFGQEQELRRELPVGRYRVQVKAQRGQNPMLAAAGTLSVSPTDVVVQQKGKAL